MWLLGLEAGVAMFLLVFIVWWTMFQGKKPEQRPPVAPSSKPPANEEPTPPAD